MLIELVSCLFVAMPVSTYLLVEKCMQGMGVELRHEIELQCHAQVFHKKSLQPSGVYQLSASQFNTSL